MTWHYVEKEFRDDADDIEGVKINYLWTPFGADPDWDQRATLFMPRIDRQSSLRKRRLKIPQRILDPATGQLTGHCVLQYYFEIIQDGQRHYSPLYTDVITTGPEAPALGEADQQPARDRAIA
jgi:hypothetical protein